MTEMNLEMRRMREEAWERDARDRHRDERDQHRDAQLKALSKAMGLPIPPVPSLQELVDKAAALTKAAAVQAAVNRVAPDDSRAKAERSRLRREVEEKQRVIDQLHSQLEAQRAGPAGVLEPSSQRTVLLRMSKQFHPDKARSKGYDKATCEAVMQAVNQLR